MKNFGPRALNETAKKNALEMRLTTNMVIVPQCAAEIKAYCYEPLEARDTEVAHDILGSVMFIRRGSEQITAWTWLKKELLEYEDALMTYRLALRTRKGIEEAKMDLMKEMLDCFGLLCHAFNDKSWLACPAHQDIGYRDEFIEVAGYVCRRMIAIEMKVNPDLCYLEALDRFFLLSSRMTPDFFAAWYDDKRSKNYDMSEAWVDDLYIVSAILSVIKTVSCEAYLE